jgi:hypothetical protein
MKPSRDAKPTGGWKFCLQNRKSREKNVKPVPGIHIRDRLFYLAELASISAQLSFRSLRAS